LLDTSQAVVAAYTYDTFGKVMIQTGALDQPYKFSTKRYDEKTGLSYYGYRYYSPALGRWMTRDPLEEAGGINLYEFVKNNPLSFVDPFGLEEVFCGPTPWGTDECCALVWNDKEGIMEAICPEKPRDVKPEKDFTDKVKLCSGKIFKRIVDVFGNWKNINPSGTSGSGGGGARL
jgi:RHS repeat-associated protein